MKKFLPYIFTLVIIANILAPISVLFTNKGTISVITNKVEAVGGVVTITTQRTNESSIYAHVVVNWNSMENVQVIQVDLKDEATGKLVSAERSPTDDTNAKTSTVTIGFTGVGGVEIAPGRKYTIFAKAWQKKDKNDTTNIIQSGTNIDYIEATPLVVTILTNNQSDNVRAGIDTNLPECSLTGGWFGGSGTFTGCLLQAFYYMIYMPTSWLFAKSGQFFDSMFAYSIADSSYRNAFVVEGWGILRDMSNVFFIFILLYVAFATVLNIHGIKTKEMIINVVIIGLLINFSLFATQVIVDTSNILARVFYNSQTLRTKTTVGNENTAQSGLNEISLSQGLVAKVDPQKIVQSQTAVHIDSTTGENVAKTGGRTKISEVDSTDWFIVILMASAINVVGIIVFLSLAIFCIARVIGLWVSMVLVPVAFFSYTVPAMQDIDTVGWRKWWPETIKLAFMAPILMFFLYIILVFLEKGFVGADVSGNDILAVIIPFVFIMMFLWKAKDIAKKLSGEIGGAAMKATSAIGSLALGGAALGTAFLGRQTIGAFMKGASTGDTAARRVAAERASGVRDPHLTRFQRLGGRLSLATGIDRAQQWAGTRLNRDQAHIEHAAHARHDLNTVAGQIAHGKKWDELTGNQRYEARRKLERDRMVRLNQGAGAPVGSEGDVGIRGGFGTRKWDSLTTAEQDAINAAIGAGAHGATPGGRLATNTTWDDLHTVRDARRKQGLASSFVQSTVTGGFDARSLSKLVPGEQDKGLNKLITGLTAVLASGIRSGFKQVGSGLNYGEGQKDFFKDLGHTITEALKSAEVKVDLSHVGEEKKEDGHGGGGHH